MATMLENAPAPTGPEQQKPQRKSFGEKFLGLFRKSEQGPQLTDEQLYGPKDRTDMTEEERNYYDKVEADKQESIKRTTEIAADAITEDYNNPNSAYNYHLDRANQRKGAAVNEVMNGNIEEASKLTAESRDQHNMATQQAKAAMSRTARYDVGRQQVVDELHDRAYKDAEEQGISINKPDNNETK